MPDLPVPWDEAIRQNIRFYELPPAACQSILSALVLVTETTSIAFYATAFLVFGILSP
jgi:hypothetical protein